MGSGTGVTIGCGGVDSGYVIGDVSRVCGMTDSVATVSRPMVGDFSAPAITTGTGFATGVVNGREAGASVKRDLGGGCTTADWSEISRVMLVSKFVNRCEMLDWTVSSAFSKASKEKTSEPNKPEVRLS
jgi:hypothetical protein